MGQNKFDPHEGQKKDQADLEVTELFHQHGDGKVKGSQTQNGEYVGGKDEKRVAGDGKDGGNGVHGEKDVGSFNDDERHEQ